ncbi:transglutaminase-like cysteine peptidase [Ruegeria sp. SCSIO 43209]|uniref:transglutaminase-like cysteine peptidase n=1 Tax=Ruegeria sp. SCSIO 43209 TaxID=2793010 RepID=UPI0021035A40|nr:transglutaminase-like cysteine peptidase [Ruegeria sp. SCSIO 43209]
MGKADMTKPTSAQKKLSERLPVYLSLACIICSYLVSAASLQASELPWIKLDREVQAPSGAKSLCKDYSWACANTRTSGLPEAQEKQIVKAINLRVNRRIRAVSDQNQYGTKEYWTLPMQGSGDCEDFALQKKFELMQNGLDPTKLLIATVLDTNRSGHAVLVYRSSEGDLILDNVTNRIKSWKETRYLFLRIQDPNHPDRWVQVSSG